MSGESLWNEANAAFVAEDWDTAATLYDQAVAASPMKPEYLISRAANHMKLKHYEAAVDKHILEMQTEIFDNKCRISTQKYPVLYLLGKTSWNQE